MAILEKDDNKDEISTDLPSELWTEIFFRLPVRTLLTLKCVRKSFLYLIESPEFPVLHFNLFNNFHNSPTKTSRLLVIQRPTNGGLITGGLFQTYKSDQSSEFTKFDLQIDPDCTCAVMGNANGLLWMYKINLPVCKWEASETVIWNPILRKYLMIPPSPSYGKDYYLNMGFGYDPVSDDYKVVSLVLINRLAVHEVYSLRTGCWEFVGTLDYGLFCYGPQVNLGQCVYWIGTALHYYGGGVDIPVVTCCDLHANKFEYYGIPEEKEHELDDRVNVVLVVNGLIAVTSISRDYTWIWVLVWSAEEWSWNVAFESESIEEWYVCLRQPISNAVFFPESSELMVSLHGKGVVSYSYRSHLIKSFNHHVIYLGSYMESLLWRELLPSSESLPNGMNQ